MGVTGQLLNKLFTTFSALFESQIVLCKWINCQCNICYSIFFNCFA